MGWLTYAGGMVAIVRLGMVVAGARKNSTYFCITYKKPLPNLILWRGFLNIENRCLFIRRLF